VTELVNSPVPVPSFVFELAIVGPVEVLQQTPLADTDCPPSLDMYPPETAVVSVMFSTGEVDTVGSDWPVVERSKAPREGGFKKGT
jgi:hypothetical protein